jgi:hypothetical protein
MSKGKAGPEGMTRAKTRGKKPGEMKPSCSPLRILIKQASLVESEGEMILQLRNNPAIDNLRHYPPEAVEKLRNLLADGALAVPDPHRRNFYDLVDSDHVYYIHISPKGKILLLALWPLEDEEERTARAPMVAEACASAR